MNSTYRVDFANVDAPDKPIVRYGLSRRVAMQLARMLSGAADIGAAYAIRTDDGSDTGQRVYTLGSYSHTDDLF